MATNYSSGAFYGISAAGITERTHITTPDSDESPGGVFLLAVMEEVEIQIDSGDLYDYDVDSALDNIDQALCDTVYDQEERALVEAWADLFGWDWDGADHSGTAMDEIRQTMREIARVAARHLLEIAEYEDEDEDYEEEYDEGDEDDEDETPPMSVVIPGLLIPMGS